MKKAYFTVLLGVTLLIFGCTFSKEPISNWGAEEIDSNLIGTWILDDNDDSEFEFIHVGYTHSDLLTFMLIGFEENGSLKQIELEGFNSTVDNSKYLNLRFLSVAETGIIDDYPNYIIVKYQLQEDTIGLAILSETSIKRAITEGVLQGVRGGMLSETVIESPQEELQEFLRTHDKEIFEDYIYLRKFYSPRLTELKLPKAFTPTPLPGPLTLQLPTHDVELIVKQRRSKAIPGSNNRIFIHLDDITGGYTLLSVKTDTGNVLHDATEVSVGETIDFQVEEHTFYITIETMRNFLAGDDYCMVSVSDVQPEPQTSATDTDENITETLTPTKTPNDSETR